MSAQNVKKSTHSRVFIGIILSIIIILLAACNKVPTTECKSNSTEIVENGKSESKMIENDTTAKENNTVDRVSATSSYEAVLETMPTATETETSTPPNIGTTPPHVHNYKTEVTPSTCTRGEITKYICTCGDSYEDIGTSLRGHDYQTQTIAPTTSSEGYDLFTCINCGDSFKENFKPKLQIEVVPTHTHNYKTEQVEATCSEGGYSRHVCSCGDVVINNETAAKGHSMEELPNDAPPCTITEVIHKCTVCGYEEVEKVTPAEHVIDMEVFNLEEDESETETARGNQERAIAVAEGSACVRCGMLVPIYTEGTENGHVFSGWKYNPHFHYRSCTTPGCMYMEATKHAYAEMRRTNPTCTMGSEVTYGCFICGKISLQVVERTALGHNFKFNKTVKPTETEPGYDLHKCTRCGAEHRVNYVSHKEHDCNWTQQEIQATCTEPGYILHTCTICKQTKRVQTDGALGHDYRHMITQPTCLKEGGKKMQCSRCADFYMTEVFPVKPHAYVLTKSEIATTGWAGYDEYTCGLCGNVKRENEVPQLKSSEYPKGYRDDTCTIIIYKEWYENAYVYAAHVTFTDYDRLWVECGKGKYNSGGETTSTAAKRVGAILAINGDYAVPGNGASGYAIARKGVVCNDKKTYAEGVYNSNTGLLLYGQSKGIGGQQLSTLVAEGKVTDTFQFGPCCLLDGKIIGDPNSTGRAQRTFIGTNGHPGDIWLCVSDGRYNDGKSAGLNGYQCGAYLKSKGCNICVPLDGGGSSTIWFNGSVLNAAKNGQRAVVDFVMFK